jgi:chromosome segregation ATPase
MALGMESIATNNIITLNGQRVPSVGKLGPIALISDVEDVKTYVDLKIKAICITGEFTPLTTTASLSAWIVQHVNSCDKQLQTKMQDYNTTIYEKINNTYIEFEKNKIDILKELNDLKPHITSCNNKLELNAEITTTLKTNILEVSNNLDNNINTIKILLNTITENVDDKIKEQNIVFNNILQTDKIDINNKLSLLEEELNNKNEKISTLQNKMEILENHNKEIMKALLSINKKISGF